MTYARTDPSATERPSVACGRSGRDRPCSVIVSNLGTHLELVGLSSKLPEYLPWTPEQVHAHHFLPTEILTVLSQWSAYTDGAEKIGMESVVACGKYSATHNIVRRTRSVRISGRRRVSTVPWACSVMLWECGGNSELSGAMAWEEWDWREKKPGQESTKSWELCQPKAVACAVVVAKHSGIGLGQVTEIAVDC